ncbi:hypothetical protein [Marinomonas primoryensis]|jgi:hypothetical protein
MVIVETPIFTKLINEIMSDDEYKELQEALVIKPDLYSASTILTGQRQLS